MHIFNHWRGFICHWQPLMVDEQRGLLVVPECPETYDKLVPLLLTSDVSALVVNMPALAQSLSNPCLNQSKPSQIHSVNAISMKRYLGQSHHLLLYKAIDEFNISVFSALCGCLSGGGLAVLIIPANHKHWSLLPDQQIYDYHSHYAQGELAPSYFKRWWQNQWHDYAGVMVVTQQAQTEIAGNSVDEACLLVALSDSHTVIAKQEQTDFVAAVMTLSQQRTGVLCLSGARGRGKSTALALACQTMYQADIPFVVTASASHGIESLQQQWQQLIQQDNLATEHHFVALDYLLSNPMPTNTLVVIEEASTLPLALIRQILIGYEKVVFANTIDGYEGTGQGVRIKLPTLLKHVRKPCQYLQFHKPLRWQPDDHLETIINGCFLPPTPDHILGASEVSNDLNSVGQALVSSAKTKHISRHCHDTKMCTIQGQKLSKQPLLLKDIFALLQQAHYQTSPQDLRLLLDHPHLTIHYWHNSLGQLMAVVCSLYEGHLSSELSLNIAKGKRRIKGHLLPQILMQQAGIAAMGEFGFQRIQRIAVHPLWQRQGLGSQVLSEITAYYDTNQSIDFIGASFAAESDVVAFWLKNKFQPVWAGLRMDTATGLPSLQVLQPLTPVAKKMLLPLQQHWFFYHQYLQRHWAKNAGVKHLAEGSLTQQLRLQTQQTFKGYPISWLPDLIHHTQDYSGNAYSLVGYLWQYLITKPTLSLDEQVWLDAALSQSLTHRQFVHQTKQLLIQLDVSQINVP